MYELFEGDNLDGLKYFTEKFSGKVSLAYLDPPYGTGRNFGEYNDVWNDRQNLIDFISERIIIIHNLLSTTGSILVHVDFRIINNIAIVLDNIFGIGDRVPSKTIKPGFRNELIWTYGLGGSSSRFYPRKHDTILWYTKGSEWYFEPPMVAATSTKLKGKYKKQPDVINIPSLNNMAKERTGYPTQKPLELLDMFICAHTNPGDIVLDPFCGSGTTIVSAVKNNRIGLGIDNNPNAIAMTKNRIEALKVL